VENLGVQRTTAGDAALLMAAIPVIVLVVEAIWLKQPVSLTRTAGIVVSFGGVFLLIRGGQATGGSNRLVGDLLVIAAAFLWAGYSLLGRTLDRVPKLAVVTYQAMYGTAMLAPAALAEHRQWRAVSSSSVLAVAYLGLLCSAVTYLLYNQALKKLAASQVTAFLNLVPVVGAAAAVLVLGEHLQLLQVLGGGVILTGVVMSARSRSEVREAARGRPPSSHPEPLSAPARPHHEAADAPRRSARDLSGRPGRHRCCLDRPSEQMLRTH
jgi:drug/metabolite transporter (DMT)-like permease